MHLSRSTALLATSAALVCAPAADAAAPVEPARVVLQRSHTAAATSDLQREASAALPEPASAALFAIGFTALAVILRLRRRRPDRPAAPDDEHTDDDATG